MRTIFLGTPQFAVPSLTFLAESQYKPLLVITQPDRPKGRKRKLQPPAVKMAAMELNFPVFQPEDVNDPESLIKIRELDPELIITVAYGGYIRKTLRMLPKYKCINLHPSLLPLYRGAAPINYALFNGDKSTGISIFQQTAKMDTGPVLWQREIAIDRKDNYTSLSARLAIEGAKDLIRVVENIEELYKNKQKQNESEATFSHKIEKQDTFIEWDYRAELILNRIRGLAEIPGAVAGFRNKRIKLIEAVLIDGDLGKPGTVHKVDKNGIVIATKDIGLLIKKVQPEGKKIMTAQAFDLGARISRGEKFSNGF
ncbi:methionyl-tRNA formyltransferase [Candidatus Cloacimonadota bacterium]